MTPVPFRIHVRSYLFTAIDSPITQSQLDYWLQLKSVTLLVNKLLQVWSDALPSPGVHRGVWGRDVVLRHRVRHHWRLLLRGISRSTARECWTGGRRPGLDSIHCVAKNDTDVAHYNFIAQQPILLIFGRDVAERVCYQLVICCPTSSN